MSGNGVDSTTQPSLEEHLQFANSLAEASVKVMKATLLCTLALHKSLDRSLEINERMFGAECESSEWGVAFRKRIKPILTRNPDTPDDFFCDLARETQNFIETDVLEI